MSIEVKNILEFLKKEELEFNYSGEVHLRIKGFCSLNNLKKDSITWVKDVNIFEKYNFTGIDNLLIVSNSIEDKSKYKNINFIFCNNPKELFFSILNNFFRTKGLKDYISPSSTVETTAIGKNVYIGHNSYIPNEAVIGNNVMIKNNVSLEGKVHIGDNTIIHSGVVIGTDGYGYFQNSSGENIKVPHYGGVIIGKDVEIGANTCIDRGTLDDTIIGDNVKIDNLCHIAHNVIIKENCSIIALSMIAGSTILEKNAYIAPGALIMNQLTIGQNSLVGLGAVVVKNVENNKVVAGVPAKIIRDNN